MTKKISLFVAILLAGLMSLPAQGSFYDTDSIQEIRIYFAESNWDHILDSLYVAGEKDRLQATIAINGTQYDSIGIRYKGFSSVSVERKKNPFNIKLDYIIDGQKHDGIDKIKLSNVIQDPSFVREVLSYEIGRKYMPASRANFANVYINDTLWGLYSNVEAVNKDFLSNHFSTNSNAFFKGNPESLDLNGENSNLSNSHGTDSTDYYPYYDMESDYGWSDLYELIDILNEDPDNIETVLNVDRALWMHAFNYALVNFDSYIGYAQNYYIYKDENGQFNPIIWDLNMSFGSFRLSDASNFWNGFSVTDAPNMDPLTHYNSVSVQPRPLMRKLFENDRYRRMFLAHLRTIMEENFSNQEYKTRAQAMQSLVDASVQADTNKFYSYADFTNNLTQTVSDLIDYPGITDLMDNRVTYLQSYTGIQGAPTLDNASLNPPVPLRGQDLTFTVEASDADHVMLAYRLGTRSLFTKVAMLDDGTQQDGGAGDGIFGKTLSNVSGVVEYYFYAENDSAGRFYPERAAYEFFKTEAQIEPGDIVINEFMASNDVTAADGAGEYDDWIELYNTTNQDISLAGLHISDKDDNLSKWPLPDVTLPAYGYQIIWADEDGSQGDWHANFKLSASGELIILSYPDDNTIIDSVTFGTQQTDISMARFPNGSGPFVSRFPTFNANNNYPLGVENEFNESGFKLYPNPAKGSVTIASSESAGFNIRVLSVEGKLAAKQSCSSGNLTYPLSLNGLTPGIYFVHLQGEKGIEVHKLIVQ